MNSQTRAFFHHSIKTGPSSAVCDQEEDEPAAGASAPAKGMGGRVDHLDN